MFRDGGAIAGRGEADTAGLEEAQIDAMFDAAVAQARPTGEKRAVCVGLQGLADKTVMDPPARVTRRLGEILRLPAVSASNCRADTFPYVVGSRANAILYTVRVTARGGSDLTFWAVATYGNRGANGGEFRLLRRNGRWTAESTGMVVIS